MYWGITCDDGWLNLLESTCEKIMKLDECDMIQFSQVKEKFGGLRIYFDIVLPDGIKESKIFIDNLCSGNTYSLGKVSKEDLWKKVQSILSKAEEDSFFTCEICGKDGKLSIKNNGFIVKTLCKKCRGTNYKIVETEK